MDKSYVLQRPSTFTIDGIKYIQDIEGYIYKKIGNEEKTLFYREKLPEVLYVYFELGTLYFVCHEKTYGYIFETMVETHKNYVWTGIMGDGIYRMKKDGKFDVTKVRPVIVARPE